MDDENRNSPAGDGFYKVYEDYSKTLRTWFVAYGIGGPVVFFTNAVFFPVLKAANKGHILHLFLAGVIIQIALTIVNKNVSWALYYGEDNSEFRDHWIYSVSGWISRQFWIDILCEVATLVLFGRATIDLVTIVSK